MPRRRRGDRALGPYRYRDGLRVVIRSGDGRREDCYFESQRTAALFVQQFNTQTASAEHTTDTAREAYLAWLRDVKGNRQSSRARTRWSLERFFPSPLPLWSLRPEVCEARYGTLTADLAPDSHRNILAEVKTFLRWCVAKHWLSKNPAEGVRGVGRRRKGKRKLRVRELRTWYNKALELAATGDDGAVAALMTVVLGMRCSEITSRKVYDVDEVNEPADTIWIPDAKTEAGRRVLDVPEDLRPALAALIDGRPADAPLFEARGKAHHWRDWPRHQVVRICTLAGVSTVCAHAMRGSAATEALERGMLGQAVAASLGHDDERTSRESYAEPGAGEARKRQAGLQLLTGGKR